jgi:acyl dehydratase
MSVPISQLLAEDGWFEDFHAGQRIRHTRAATIGEVEGAFLSKLVVNTAQAHWNEHLLRHEALGSGRLVFGLLTASVVFGLAGADTTEHAICELSCTGLRFRAPVHHGDTIEAFTEVLATYPRTDRPDAGVAEFQHWGRRQDGVIVFEGQRSILIRRRPTRSP